jgi:hypothetical protein
MRNANCALHRGAWQRTTPKALHRGAWQRTTPKALHPRAQGQRSRGRGGAPPWVTPSHYHAYPEGVLQIENQGLVERLRRTEGGWDRIPRVRRVCRLRRHPRRPWAIGSNRFAVKTAVSAIAVAPRPTPKLCPLLFRSLCLCASALCLWSAPCIERSSITITSTADAEHEHEGGSPSVSLYFCLSVLL